jgi:hypothetical protein
MFVDVVDDALFERQDIFFAVCLIRWRAKRELEYLAADEHFEECGLVEILAGFGFATLSHGGYLCHGNFLIGAPTATKNARAAPQRKSNPIMSSAVFIKSALVLLRHNRNSHSLRAN